MDLVRQGYALAYTKYPFKQEYLDLFRVCEREAREHKRGL
jgi:endonuclease YncB( thermonuclease family)